MSVKGVQQLQRLTIRYCDLGGSSRGMRQYIFDNLIDWAERNPNTEVATEIVRNKHPFVRGEYLSGDPKVICVKNMDPDEIGAFVQRLRDSSGRKMTRIAEPVRSEAMSIQGIWTPTVPFQRLETSMEHHY